MAVYAGSTFAGDFHRLSGLGNLDIRTRILDKHLRSSGRVDLRLSCTAAELLKRVAYCVIFVHTS